MDELDEQNLKNKPLSVTEAMALAKGALESCTLTLVGEVSELSNKAGYKAVYFTVKDEGASLPAMMWNNRYAASGVDLKIGMLVQLSGRFTLYAPKGRMNFDVFSLSAAGEGDLRQKVADLAKKLQAEGLMDASRKRALPSFPQTIGLVTSPRGAAVHDVLRTLRRRFPAVHVLLAGVPVEGAAAPAALAQGMSVVASAGAELILLVRGGGSFEDLMPFNDEGLARAIVACPVPVVSGIGHEPDTSIADMVADFRASTPTGAAEAVVPDTLELSASLAAMQAHIVRTLNARIQQNSTFLEGLAKRPVLSDPGHLFAEAEQSLDFALGRLQRAIPANIERNNTKLAELQLRIKTAGSARLERLNADLGAKAARLDDLSPLSVLGRGWALAKNDCGNLITSVSQVQPDDTVYLSVSDGTIKARVESYEYANREIAIWKEDA